MAALRERMRHYQPNWRGPLVGFEKEIPALLVEIEALRARLARQDALLEEANDVLRSTASIADREGKKVRWSTFQVRVHKVLQDQHRWMYPEQYRAALDVLDTPAEEKVSSARCTRCEVRTSGRLIQAQASTTCGVSR